jgi:hypothetical protein
MLSPIFVCLIAQKSKNRVIQIPKIIVKNQEKLINALSNLILINPRKLRFPLSSISMPEISLTIFFEFVFPFSWSSPTFVFQRELFKAVIKIRERLTANEIKTGATSSFMSSSRAIYFGRRSFGNNLSKIRIRTIKGESAIANRKIPILANKTATRATRGRSNNIANPALIKATIKFCHIPKLLVPRLEKFSMLV